MFNENKPSDPGLKTKGFQGEKGGVMDQKEYSGSQWHLSRRHVVGSINTYIHSDGRGVQELMIKQLMLGMVQTGGKIGVWSMELNIYQSIQILPL